MWNYIIPIVVMVISIAGLFGFNMAHKREIMSVGLLLTVGVVCGIIVLTVFGIWGQQVDNKREQAFVDRIIAMCKPFGGIAPGSVNEKLTEVDYRYSYTCKKGVRKVYVDYHNTDINYHP